MEAFVVVVEQAAENSARFEEGLLAVGAAVVGAVELAEHGHEKVVSRHGRVGVAGEGAEEVEGGAERADVVGRAGVDEGVNAGRLGRECLSERALNVSVGEHLGAECGAQQFLHLREFTLQFFGCLTVSDGATVRLKAADLDVADQTEKLCSVDVRYVHPRPERRRLNLPVHFREKLPRAGLDDFGDGAGHGAVGRLGNEYDRECKM